MGFFYCLPYNGSMKEMLKIEKDKENINHSPHEEKFEEIIRDIVIKTNQIEEYLTELGILKRMGDLYDENGKLKEKGETYIVPHEYTSNYKNDKNDVFFYPDIKKEDLDERINKVLSGSIFKELADDSKKYSGKSDITETSDIKKENNNEKNIIKEKATELVWLNNLLTRVFLRQSEALKKSTSPETKEKLFNGGIDEIKRLNEFFENKNIPQEVKERELEGMIKNNKVLKENMYPKK